MVNIVLMQRFACWLEGEKGVLQTFTVEFLTSAVHLFFSFPRENS